MILGTVDVEMLEVVAYAIHRRMFVKIAGAAIQESSIEIILNPP
jgi:hypothetical protein